MAEAKRDANMIATLLGVSSADGITPVTIYVDPTTHRVLVSAATAGAAGLDTEVQFNDGGIIAGDAGFTYNKTSNVATLGGLIISGLTASELVASDGSKNLVSLAVATYPSLTELAYVKGVTSAIQTQLNARATLTGTETLTNKRITPRVTTIVSNANPTINTDNCDAVTITAQAAAIASMTTNLSGTPNNFDKLLIRIKDDGTARAITWGASFEAKGVALPTTTVISKVLTVLFIYDSVSTKWGCVAALNEV